MINIHGYMRKTSREVARQGILHYLEEYSHPDEIIKGANSHLSLLRVTDSKGKGRKKTLDRPQLISTFGRIIYENLSQNNNWEDIIPFLASTELILTSTYLIDDIVDEQEKRFNDDTTWKKYGTNEAIFAAFRLREIAEKTIINKLNTNLENKVKILDLFSDIHRKTYDGQSLNDRLIRDYNHETYLERCKDFGAVFISCVAEGSAILANSNKTDLVKKIGDNYGVAIMIRNDLKDYMTTEIIESTLNMSKALKRIPLEDFRIGRITYPLYIALNDKRYVNKLKTLIGKKELTSEEEKEIVIAVANSGGFDETIELIEDYKQKALEYWKELPENESKYILKDLINLMKNSREYANLMKDKYSRNGN